MAKVNFYVTNTQKLPELPVAAGNIIYTVDIPRMYLDYDGTRLSYSVIELDDDEARTSKQSPQNGYYYVNDTNVFWRYYNGTWKQLTPSNVKPIYFADNVKDFPDEGKEDTVYTTYDAVYRWDKRSDEYTVVANKTAWKTLA